MAFQRPGFQAHKERVETVKSLYLKPADFDKQRKVRPLFWIYGDNIVDILFYQEGWHIPDEIDPKTKKPKYPNGKPVRFPAEMEPSEFPQLEWKEESYGGGKPRPSLPKSTASLLLWDYESNDLKIASFHQKTVLKILNEYISPANEDGSVNESYVENLTSVDLVIKRITEKDWNISIKEGNPKIPLEAWNAMGMFQFSWDLFMECEADLSNAPMLADFSDRLEGEIEVETKEEQQKRIEKINKAKEAAANKNIKTGSTSTSAQKVTPTTKTVVQKAVSESQESWRDLKTSKGTPLGSMELKTLQGLVNWFETEKKDTYKTSKLYHGAVAGIKELSPPVEEAESFEEGEVEEEGSPF